MTLPAFHRSARTVLCALAVAACTPSEDNPAPSDDSTGGDIIEAMGHGRYLARGFRVLEPSPELFDRTQRALIDRLSREAAAAGVDVDAERARASVAQSDPLLANAALIDRLLELAPPGDHATIQSVNDAIRFEHARSQPGGVEAVARVTFNAGEKYIEECRAAGVPIPPPMYRTGDGNWTRLGILDPVNFLGGVAELWEHRAPNGRCLALPRYTSDLAGNVTDQAAPFGIICVGMGEGTGTNKACFWDNKFGVPHTAGVEAPLSTFLGGYDLAYNAQGVCTDCHAGANPFVVHPNDDAFATLLGGRDQTPTGWYEPIVHTSWPQNRGPSNLLAGVSSDRRCDAGFCHAAARDGGLAGQFPILSSELPEYCGRILAQTAGIFGGTPETMPPGLGDVPRYENHRRSLRDACASKPDPGKVVTGPSLPTNPTFVSPPTLQTVAYDCAQRVEVNNVALGATVTLTVNGTSYLQVAENVQHIEFALSAPLAVGDVLTASQKIGGVVSPTATIVVRDHSIDYPSGLPAPVVNPDLVHECADVIAVASVPGALVTVESTVGPTIAGYTSSGWTSFWPGRRTFVIGDQFRARQQMCPSEPQSPWSASVTAVAAPASMPTPVLDPARAYDGQQLVNISNLANGARTKFSVAGADAGTLDAPISWWTNFNLASALGRALRDGETLTARSRLCTSAPTVTIPVSKCGELPAPRIETPLVVGARAVIVERSQPGARIRVVDASGAEIGNGGGIVINLSRALVAGDELRVIQELGACQSATAHLVYVTSGQ